MGDSPIVITFENGHKYSIDSTGKIGEYIIPPSVADYVKVGDYVDYDPTKLDANKNQNVDSSKLIYTSPTGTGQSHGNGYTSAEEDGGQTFTAKSGLKWRVLSISDDKIELISETPIKKDAENQDNGNFVLNGAIGYLYVEQELNEICKIYGYGYGADTTIGSKFTVGGPLDTETIVISETGARSITVEDINKLAGIYEDEKDGKIKYNDGTLVSSTYGDMTNPTSNVYYPTISRTTGKSDSAGVKELISNYYQYSPSEISQANLQDIIFNGLYWLGSRSVGPSANRVVFHTRIVTSRWCVFYGYVLWTLI